MNFIEKGVRKLDATQQGHKPLAIIFGVIKKFGDDNGGVLAGSLTFTAFGALFPLLLLLVTILGLVVGTSGSLHDQVLNSTLRNFPIIGTDLQGNIKAIHRNSATGLIVGILGLTWGSLGLAQNGIFTMEQIWNLPGPDRPNYIKRLGRSVSFLGVLGVGMAASTVLAAASPVAKGSWLLTLLGSLISAVLNVGLFLFAYRVLTPTKVHVRQLIPGAVLAGLVWTVMQALGGIIVQHYLKNDSALYGTFAIVLGLLAWIYLIVQVVIYAAELNVVLARRLYPRSIVQPPLTEADRRAMSAEAVQYRRRPEQRVDVSFEDDPDTYGDAGQPSDNITGREVDVTETAEHRRRASQESGFKA